MTLLWGQVRAANIYRPQPPKTDAATINAKYWKDMYRGYIHIMLYRPENTLCVRVCTVENTP